MYASFRAQVGILDLEKQEKLSFDNGKDINCQN